MFEPIDLDAPVMSDDDIEEMLEELDPALAERWRELIAQPVDYAAPYT